MFDYATKIQALLANANDERLTDEARASYQAKAQQLMQKYRIEEEEALAAGVPGFSGPISKEIVLSTRAGEFYTSYIVIMRYCADHAGVRFEPRWEGSAIHATLVGYEGDVRYAEFLYTAAYLMFATRIDPVWDASLTEAENIYFLRNAGIERRKVADKAWGYGAGCESSNRNKVQRIYLKECARREEPARAAGLSHDTTVYRAAYRDSFLSTLYYRLKAAVDATDAVSGGLVLHGRKERVDEAFYSLFPKRRPSTEPVPTFECEDCKRTKHESGQCKAHRPRRWTKADEARYQRDTNSASAKQGRRSGREAAEGVLIRGLSKQDKIEA